MEFRESKKHIQQKLKNLENDLDRDVRENIFSAFSEKEKTESPSTDDHSDEIISFPNTTPTFEIQDVTAAANPIATPDDV